MSSTSISGAKNDFTRIVRDVEEHGARVVVRRRGKPVAVIVPFDPARDGKGTGDWLDGIWGVAAERPDFAWVFSEVVRRRAGRRSRRVVL